MRLTNIFENLSNEVKLLDAKVFNIKYLYVLGFKKVIVIFKEFYKLLVILPIDKLHIGILIVLVF